MLFNRVFFKLFDRRNNTSGLFLRVQCMKISLFLRRKLHGVNPSFRNFMTQSNQIGFSLNGICESVDKRFPPVTSSNLWVQVSE